MFRKLCLFTLWLVLSSFAAQADVTKHQLVFPHLLKGTFGLYFETVIFVSNPGSEPIEIELTSEAFDFEFEDMPLSLAPLETREIRFEGGAFQAGSVRLTADKDVAASAVILSKPDENSSEVISEVSVFASEPTAKAVVPVFVQSEIAEDTGIALFYVFPEGGVQLRFSLYDFSGQVLVTRTERAPFHPGTSNFGRSEAAFLLTELFPALPSGFSQGLLVIEQAFPDVPDTFAALALYTNGTSFRTAEVATVDTVSAYTVRPKSFERLTETAEQLAATYGFDIRFIVPDTFIAILATKEVARAVARNPLIEEVCQDFPLVLSLTN